MTKPHYVRRLSNEQIISRLGRELHPLKKGADSCYEMAVLVHRLKAADLRELVASLDQIERLARVSMTSKLKGPMLCPKCIAKLFVFAAVIAGDEFRERRRLFRHVACKLITHAPSLKPSSLDAMEFEVDWYIRSVEGHPEALGRLQ